jgi:hypothetical protein
LPETIVKLKKKKESRDTTPDKSRTDEYQVKGRGITPTSEFTTSNNVQNR